MSNVQNYIGMWIKMAKLASKLTLEPSHGAMKLRLADISHKK